MNNTNDILIGALKGRTAHLSAKRALEGLTYSISGVSVQNCPYTVWQLIYHINYWQKNWVLRLEGHEVEEDDTSALGWTDEENAPSPDELQTAIKYLYSTIDRAIEILQSNKVPVLVKNRYYSDHYQLIQAMASHLSYHLGEVVLIRRILGDWPPESGGYVW